MDIYDLPRRLFGVIIRNLYNDDIVALMCTCKYIHGAVMLDPTWAKYTEHIGRFFEHFDGTNPFCVNMIIGDNSSGDSDESTVVSVLNDKRIKFSTTCPLDRRVVDALFISHSLNRYKLIHCHDTTLDYVMENYKDTMENMFMYHIIRFKRYNHIVAKYNLAVDAETELLNMAKHGNMDALAMALERTKTTMEQFAQKYISDIIKQMNIDLFNRCVQYVNPDTIKIGEIRNYLYAHRKSISIKRRHLMIIKYLIDNKLMIMHLINLIIRLTNSEMICALLIEHINNMEGELQFKLSWYVDFALINPCFLDALMNLEINNYDRLLNFNLHLNNTTILVGDLFDVKKPFPSNRGIIKFGHYLRFRIKQLLRFNDVFDSKSAYLWRYILKEYGEKEFVYTLKKYHKNIKWPMIAAIKKFYPRILEII